ncbi:MAG TPA: glucoamylase family protein [Vicinamibacteria bacterium]|nr:glucoamylase family protein [Vicinamibacteria bacterium]
MRTRALPPAQVPQRALDELQQESFSYFLHETNPGNGLVRDKTRKDWPASIAAVGMALAAYPVGVERGFLTRTEAAHRTLATLRFFWRSPQGPQPDATGHKGFYYHFLDMATGRRALGSELSTIDTALFVAGALTAAAYYQEDAEQEAEIRKLADALYRRVDWRWALNRGATVSHGWEPGHGFLKYRWEGYDEAIILYVLGLGSPTLPLPRESYDAWLSTYAWRKIYGHEFVHAGPLFVHQMSHLWIDFRGIQDRYLRERELDYFENSRRATHVQQEYAVRNPRGFEGYSRNCWGLTASEGPGPKMLRLNGVWRRFYDYVARGVPHGPDDGTLAPWAVVTSLPFAPEIVIPSILYYREKLNLHAANPYGFKATFNPTFPERKRSKWGWVSPHHFGINEGPIVIMIENDRTELVWRLMRSCPYIVAGLRRAGFKGGWL